MRQDIEQARKNGGAELDALTHTYLKHSTALKERNDKALKLVSRMGERWLLSQEIVDSYCRSFRLHDLFRIFINDPSLDNSRPHNLREEQEVSPEHTRLVKEPASFLDYFFDERQILLHLHAPFAARGCPAGPEGVQFPLVDDFLLWSIALLSREGLAALVAGCIKKVLIFIDFFVKGWLRNFFNFF